MAQKGHLKTVRFSQREDQLIAEYLKQNQLFDSFSALARIATLSFIKDKEALSLHPVKTRANPRLSFLWDYDLDEVAIREIMGERGLSPRKKWMIERLLSEGRFRDIFDYLSVADIRRALPFLRFPEKTKARWDYALKRWSVHD